MATIKQTIFNILDAINIRCNFIYPRAWQKWALNKQLKGKELVGVEIGVFKGRHSDYILSKSNVKKLYCVDPYEDYNTDMFDDESVENNLIRCKWIAHERLRKYGDKVVWIEKTSFDAVKDIPNELDFVYLDGNHEYEFVKEELELYYPKLKKGGVLAGHDFFKLDAKDNIVNVVQAVIEFAVKYDLELYTWYPDFWMFRK